MQIFDQSNRITTDALTELKKHADMIECECPTHLIAILEQIRAFENYSFTCIERFPNDAKTHAWLMESAKNLDHMLSNTIAQLARFEGFIDAENNFVPRAK